MMVRIEKGRDKPCSHKLVQDDRRLLWIITLGGLLLAFYCVHRQYSGALPWIGLMVGPAWAAHGAVCACYLNMAKSDHSRGGITYEAAKANGFQNSPKGGQDSPAI